MKKNIDNYIGSIVHDNEDAIMNGWYSSIADYIIHNAENGAGWYEYFDDSETENNLGEPTQEQIDELEAYLEENYNYLPEQYVSASKYHQRAFIILLGGNYDITNY